MDVYVVIGVDEASGSVEECHVFAERRSAERFFYEKIREEMNNSGFDIDGSFDLDQNYSDFLLFAAPDEGTRWDIFSPVSVIS